MKPYILAACMLFVSCEIVSKDLFNGRPASEKGAEKLLHDLKAGDQLNGLFGGAKHLLNDITLETIVGGPGSTGDTSKVSFLVDRNSQRWITVRYSPKRSFLPREMKQILNGVNSFDVPTLMVREILRKGSGRD